MALGIGKIIVGIVLMFIVIGVLGTYDLAYGTGQQAASLNNTNAQSYSNYTLNVYNPLTAQVSNSVNSTNNLASSSQANGFAYAFLPIEFGNMYTQITQSPSILSNYVSALLIGLNIPGINVTEYTIAIRGIMLVFLALLAISLWTKYNIWG